MGRHVDPSRLFILILIWPVYVLTPKVTTCGTEAANIVNLVVGLDPIGSQITINHTGGEHANHN